MDQSWGLQSFALILGDEACACMYVRTHIPSVRLASWTLCHPQQPGWPLHLPQQLNTANAHHTQIHRTDIYQFTLPLTSHAHLVSNTLTLFFFVFVTYRTNVCLFNTISGLVDHQSLFQSFENGMYFVIDNCIWETQASFSLQDSWLVLDNLFV